MHSQQNKSYTGDIVVGIVGGSGLYDIAGFENAREESVISPYGDPSDSFVVGEMYGVKVVFLARHGRHHTYLPSEVPYRANIYGFKKLGVSHLLSISAVGSFREHLPPQSMVVVDQYIDYTKNRVSTFFGEGMVGHVSMAYPTCTVLGDILYDAATLVLKGSEKHVQKGGTYLCMEGPQFSSRAESLQYRAMGCDVIGMTNMPEAKLAREAQIAYAPLAMVTDFDCWHEGEVVVSELIANLHANASNAQKIVAQTVKQIALQRPVSLAHTALKDAVFTPYDVLSQEKKDLLDMLKK